MSETVKKIEKAKSFDKRISILFNSTPLPTGGDLTTCLQLIVEKAKYGEHFAQIAYICETKKLNDIETLNICASKAQDHPKQTGIAIRALYYNDHKPEAIKVWREMLDRNNNIPSYYAQTLSIGRRFPETEKEAEKLIATFISSSDEAKEYESLTEVSPSPTYNFI
jgi:hypothetical protein